jgi:hypothetical protein
MAVVLAEKVLVERVAAEAEQVLSVYLQVMEVVLEEQVVMD